MSAEKNTRFTFLESPIYVRIFLSTLVAIATNWGGGEVFLRAVGMKNYSHGSLRHKGLS